MCICGDGRFAVHWFWGWMKGRPAALRCAVMMGDDLGCGKSSSTDQVGWCHSQKDAPLMLDGLSRALRARPWMIAW